MSNLTQFYQSGQGAVNTVTVFTYSGTWVAPPGVTRATVLVWGAGGSGACNTNAYSGTHATGGGGGGFVKGIVAVTPGTSYSITVGVGGSLNASQGTNGSAGGTSSFSTLLTATGGGGGQYLGGNQPTSGTGSSSGALWTFTAAGGGSGSTRSMSVSNVIGSGGGGSGSPYGDGGIAWNNFYTMYATGGGGWGGNSAGEPNVNDYQVIPGFGTGGGGLMNGGSGYGGGGGGSSAPGANNPGSGNIPTISSQSVYMCTPGGNAASAPTFLFVTGGTPTFISLGGWSESGQRSASYFDILNCNLTGTGGYGVPYQGTYNIDPISFAGNGGAGGGGGGLMASWSTSSNKGVRAGNGGTGGGGGGAYLTNTVWAQSGTGGFGGGGGGIFTNAQQNNYAGGGGLGGGGGGGGSNSQSSGNYCAGGFGGRGCVLIFYRAT